MGDGTEPPPRLDPATLRRLLAKVATLVTRQDLNRFTVAQWRTYDTPKNAAALAQLRARIEAQRAVIEHSRPT